MRATLAKPVHGLAATWMSPFPTNAVTHWQFQSLGLGDPIGQGLVQTIQGGLPGSADVRTLLSILGDPTLRMNVIAPPQGVTCSASGASFEVKWLGSVNEPNCTYYVYNSPNMQTAFTRIAGPLTSTNLPISSCSGKYMVRAAKTITTGSGAFVNFSQGAFSP